MDKELGNRIKQLRQQSDLTQTQLAKLLSVSPALISAYELGDRKPSLEILVSLAATFRVSTDYLLGVKNQIPCSLDGLSTEEAQAIQILLHALRSKTK
ncbi:MAG: helix-turn-helix transcriptional regulator [Hungatella sp.]|nr:helix-turn-helix transcriptional regulator [Hungatella sp.]